MAAIAKHKRLWIVAFVAAAIVVLLVVLTLAPRDMGPRAAEPSQVSSPSIDLRPPHAIAPRIVKPASSPPVAAQPGQPIPPVIDEIIVEKEEVCEGEENLVTVKAHTLDGSDAFLHYVIGGERGTSVPVKTYLDPSGKPRQQFILAFGNQNVSTRVEMPSYKVKQCTPERVVTVGSQVRANRIREYEFFAKVIDSGTGKPFKPRQFVWDFGDDETAVTSTGYITHAYQHGVQKGLYTSYLVRVEVQGDSGETAIGRTSLQFHNLAYENLIKFRVVNLVGQGTPRFPVMGKDGVVRQKFEIWHYYDQPVEIQKVTLVRHDSDARRIEDKELDLSLILDETEIVPGKSIEAELTLDASKYPDVIALVYRLEGTSADGKRAIGEVSVMKPPPKPSRENGTPISDPKLIAKIHRALELLGQDTVTQEDLWRLEREGKLQ